MSSKFLSNKTKKAIKDVVFDYKNKHDAAIKKLGISEEQYIKKVRKIRKKVFSDFEKNLSDAKQSLIDNGFKVHEAEDSKQAQKIFWRANFVNCAANHEKGSRLLPES